MRTRTWVIAAILSGLAQAGGIAARAAEPAPPQADWASWAAFRALVGHTLVYAKPDRPDRETGVFLRLDGTGTAVTRGPDGTGEPRPIRWAQLSDGQFCITDAGRRLWDGDCGKLSVDGMTATLTPASGPAWSGRILDGDAWKLDPSARADDRLAGRAAIEALVGNTMLFISYAGDKAYRAHYLMADGKARRAHNDQPDFNNWALQPDEKWSIRGPADQLCFSGGAWKETFCSTLSIAGDLITMHDDRVGPLHAMLLKGDARNLSPAAEAAVGKKAAALVDHSLLLTAAERGAKTDSTLYFMRKGSGRAKWRAGAPVPIKWMIQLDGKLCVVEQPRDYRDQNCTALAIDGDAVTLSGPDRAPITGRIVKGNALKK